MFNHKHTKTNASKLNYAFMLSAIASVLVLGTGYNSMQSFGQGFDSLPGFDIASQIGQSADCAGMLNDCGNDNGVQNPPGETPPGPTPEPTECELCLAQLSDEQEAILLAALEVGTLAQACLLADIDAAALLAELTEDGLSIDVITDIFACLDLELPIAPP